MLDNQRQGGNNREGGSREATLERNQISAHAISLPKGGGAIRGIGEKFAANPVTGTGSLSVPIATSPGRAGFGPQLSLSYDSGAGNGPFGLGWNLSLPAITRKTDKGLPRYRDADESDVFILSGAEDLVPLLEDGGGQWQRHEETRAIEGVPYRVQRYRPRIEGLFARIERWTNLQTDETHWRSITKDNVTTLYGKTAESRVADPDDPRRVFSWLICQSYDDKGNAIVYKYVEENSDGVVLSQAHEKNRTPLSRSANRYLKRIKYGNRTPNRDADWQATDPAQLTNWMFEVVLDYGEGHSETVSPPGDDPVRVSASLDPTGTWPARQDPFSTYRAGFEVRTYRLCRRVLMFHHFPNELDIENYLVRSTDFTYDEGPIASFITSVSQSGYVRQNGDIYLKKSLPPLELEYSPAIISDEIIDIDPNSLENLPYGLDGAQYRWVDLDGEGISGILTEQGDAWYYKPNMGNGRFDPIERVANRPSLAALNGGRQQLLDLAGDGQLDLAMLDAPTPGFYERTHDERWATFRAFSSLPNIAWNDPNLRFVDLTGDGHADILVTEDNAFNWHLSLAEAGFSARESVRQLLDEERGPRLVFADGTQSIYLADLSGDGLTDLARIRNGEVCYWPNLGYGRFGAKVTMDNAPWFDAPDLFSQQRIQLADIDGSGTTDIIYLWHDVISIYRNQSGNGWEDAERLVNFPNTDDLSSVTVVDLLGNGTACLVWSSPLPGDTRQPMRYLDLMGGQKPHLMIATRNNMGAETHVHYASSTKFYLADKAAGQPWITKLPFPVHVVERVGTYDRISRNRFVTRYVYHHGYFDGIEREFRGFGMVEQLDTEEFAALEADGLLEDAENLDKASHVPPVHTKTWFHTGVYLGRDRVSNFFAGLLDEHDRGEYYREPAWRDDDTEARKHLLPDTIMPPGLTLEEEREACRALRGSMLRQEVYALDGTDKEEHPYTVTEQNFAVRRLQPHDGNRHAVFFTHPREAITYHYERMLFPVLNEQIVDELTAAANPNVKHLPDPRVTHTLTLEVDDFGNVLKQVAIGYGRRFSDLGLPSQPDRDKQTQTLVTYTENRVTNEIDSADDYHTPLPCETRTYELTGYTPTGSAGWFQRADFLQSAANGLTHIFDSEIAYEDLPTNGKQRRLIEQVRTLYRPDDLGAAQNDPLTLLPLGTVERLALPGESYKLAFTPGLLARVFQGDGQPLLPDPADVLGGQGADRGGYLPSQQLKADGRFPNSDPDDHWWIPAGRAFHSPDEGDTPAQELDYARRHFFLPHRYRDPFGATTTVTYDRPQDAAAPPYDLLIQETVDPLGNRVTVGERLPNGDIDATKPGNDYRVLQPRLITDPNRNCAAVAFDALGMVVYTAVMGKPEENLGDSLDGFEADLTEAVILDHLSDPLADPHAILGRATTRLVYDLFAYQRTKDQPDPQPAAVYALARETHDADLDPGQQTRVQHSFSYSDGFGREIQKKIQAEPERINGVAGPPRWVGSGWTIFNNKGKPVRQYEPFFSDLPPEEGHRFEFGVQVGVSPVLFYDPVERVVATLHPNHTYEKVVFDPWQQQTWDVNDTVLVADPKTDTDVGDFFRRLPDEEYLPTWHTQRISGSLGSAEQDAAEKAAAHAETPSEAFLDSLGRPFLTVADNGPQGKYETRVELDIEGNQRAVIDAKGRTVMRYEYDMLGDQVRQDSMEAGTRWGLANVAGNLIYRWDSRDHRLRTTYDELQRPSELFLQEAGGAELLVERRVYGEGQGEANNHRGQVFQQFDGAGVVTFEEYDYKGNLRRSQREFARDYDATLDWGGNPALEPENTFTTRTEYDALNRPTEITTPDDSVTRPTYNEANLLERLDVNLRGAGTVTNFVANIDYNARGQRTLIEYGNGVNTTYDYDDQTFRLTNLKTTRTSDGDLQNLHYAFDPVGNITSIRDQAQQTIFFNNAVVEPHAGYTYDAVYQLIEATGREHIGQVGTPHITWKDTPRFVTGIPHPNQPEAMRLYTEKYEYDPVGNFEKLIHQAANGSWTRSYLYDEDSQLDPGQRSNRLTSTTIGTTMTETYSISGDGYDDHGNMLRMPHLSLIRWDYRDQLQATAQQVVNSGTPETTWYVYDASGQRVRKVTERQNGTQQKERLYLGGFEIYREYNGSGSTVTLKRETLHIMDDQQRIALVETKTFERGILSRVRDFLNPQGPLIRYQLGNHLGSASLELDEQAQIISYEEYYPYGNTSYQAGRSQAEVQQKRYRYTGMERDEESGLSYHRARYYAPWLGRWTSADPEGFVDGTDLYSYVRNNPVVMVDSDGKQAVPAQAPVPTPAPAPANSNIPTPTPANSNIPTPTPANSNVSSPGGARSIRTLPRAAPRALSGLRAGIASSQISAWMSAAAAMFQTADLSMQRRANIVRTAKINSSGGLEPGNVFGVRNPGLPLLNTEHRLRPYVVPTPETKSKPDEGEKRRRRKPKETVNLDTSAIVGATSLANTLTALGTQVYLADKDLVATKAALKEFKEGNFKSAGPQEKILAALFLLRVTEIPNDPSDRVMKLKAESKRAQKMLGQVDRIIFGTGDKRRIKTVTFDARFPRRAKQQGVILDVVVLRRFEKGYSGK